MPDTKNEPKPGDPQDAPKATPIQPGPPVEGVALSQTGATFAERAKARKKAVRADDAEDKSVASASTKASRSSARKS